MRLHRENELVHVRQVFEVNAVGEGDLAAIPLDRMPECLVELGQDPERARLPAPGEDPVSFDFEAYVGVVDTCRDACVAKERRKAGFSETDINHFKELFENFDKDGSGEIEGSELRQLLKDFGWEPKSREEQHLLVKKLQKARTLALEAGVEDVSPIGGTIVRFWEFVQLARMLHSQYDRQEEDRLSRAVQELKLSKTEVDEFRTVFRNTADGNTLISDKARRLVRSVAAPINSQQRAQLDGKVLELENNGELDFVAFLRLMRWLVDVDFAGIKTGKEAAARRGL